MRSRMSFACAPIVAASGLALAACSSSSGTAPPADGGPLVDTGSTTGVLSFQPSNITMADITAQVAQAQDEDVTASCQIQTDPVSPDTDCFTSPIVAATQPDGTPINLVVVKSLRVETNGAVDATGGVAVVVVSLGDMTILGSVTGDSAANGNTQPNAMGTGPGGGAPASATSYVGGSGGSFCGIGGGGGGQTATGTTYGSEDNRPLSGGSAGGGGTVGSGNGGGAVQLVAGGTFAVQTGAYVTVGGQGGASGGLATDQNAGGGGSGGSILIEATTVEVAGILAANGGGGGGGYADGTGADGTPTGAPAPGGQGSPAGGNGSAGPTIDGAPGSSPSMMNAGGGGGGAGRIRINTASGMAGITGTVSPATSTPCATVGTVRAAGTGP